MRAAVNVGEEDCELHGCSEKEDDAVEDEEDEDDKGKEEEQDGGLLLDCTSTISISPF